MYSTMSLAELKNNVLALPETERHDLAVWLTRMEQIHGDIHSSERVSLARLLETDPLKLTQEQFRASMEADFFEQ
jgi:hypothetical protein